MYVVVVVVIIIIIIIIINIIILSQFAVCQRAISVLLFCLHSLRRVRKIAKTDC
jgi:hypothetical protein